MVTQSNTFQQMELRIGLWIFHVDDQLSQVLAMAKLLMNIDMKGLKDKATGDEPYHLVQASISQAKPGMDKLQYRQRKLQENHMQLLMKFETLENYQIEDNSPGCKKDDRW